MRVTSVVLTIVFTLISRAAAAAPLGDAADLPAVGQWPVELKGLPKGVALGSPPAPLLAGQSVYSAAKNSPDAKKILAMIEESVYSFKLDRRNPNYQWYTVRLLGADAAGFDLESGRIWRIGYLYKKLPKQRAEAAIKEFARLDPKAELFPKPDPAADPKAPPVPPNRAVITLEGLRLTCQIHRPVGLAGAEPNSPGMIVYQVYSSDWYLLTHKPDDAVAQSIRDEQVTIGMTEEEAIAAMPDCKVQREASANERLVWLNFYSSLTDSSLPRAKVYLNDGHVRDVQQRVDKR